MTTDKQKRAIAFCNEQCDEKFTGDINNFTEVSKYLSTHLAQAKERGNRPRHHVTAQRMLDYSREAFSMFNHEYDNDGTDWDYIESGLRPF